MQLRVIKERWNADDSPMVDESRPHRPQLINGGSVVVVNAATGRPENYRPGELIELAPEAARNLLRSAPQSVELESEYQARQIRLRAQDTARETERLSLDARMRELDQQTQQAQKLRAMAEERERTLAAENLRVSQVAAGKDAQLDEMKKQMAAMSAAYEQRMRELEERLTAPPAAPAAPAAPQVSASDPDKPRRK